MKLGLLLLLALVSARASAEKCGARADNASWFFLGDAPPQYATAANLVLKALRTGLEREMLAHEPACLRVTVVTDLRSRSSALDRPGSRHGLPSGAVGFHVARLGADDVVYVTPNRSIPLDVLMLHECLHALSHRWSAESQRRHVAFFNESVTDYITRELAVIINGHARGSLHSGYDEGVPVVAALMARLAKQGPQMLADAYLRDGYDAFEAEVDRRLGVHLGVAARALEGHDAQAALSILGATH